MMSLFKRLLCVGHLGKVLFLSGVWVATLICLCVFNVAEAIKTQNMAEIPAVYQLSLNNQYTSSVNHLTCVWRLLNCRTLLEGGVFNLHGKLGKTTQTIVVWITKLIYMCREA